jgi:hypothetical protein
VFAIAVATSSVKSTKRRSASAGSTSLREDARVIGRLEEALVVCDDEAAQPCFEVDDVLLEHVGGYERASRV